MKKFNIHALILTSTAVLVVVGSRSAYTQSSTKTLGEATSPAVLERLNHRNSTGFNAAENRWQLQAVDLSTQLDHVSPVDRKVRNAYWDKTLKPLSDLSDAGLKMARREGPPALNDVTSDPQATWIVANFSGYLVLPTSDAERTLYTEASLSVIEVVLQPANGTIKPGEIISADFAGGRIKSHKGELHEFLLEPHRHFIAPYKTYLLKVRYNSAGGFYEIQKQFQVVDGQVTGGSEGAGRLSGRSLASAKSEVVLQSQRKGGHE